MKKILVTGYAGFIGSHLCEKLLKEGYKVIGIDNFNDFYDPEIKRKNTNGFKNQVGFKGYKFDLIDQKKLEACFAENEIGSVIHLAASAGVRPSMKEPVSYASNNITVLATLLHAMQQNGIDNLVFASSSSVYGGIEEIPFRENMKLDKIMSTYAATKLSGEILNQLYHDSYNFSVINLRFFTVYGPRQRPDLAINKFFGMLRNNDTITLFGDGLLKRDYTYIDDIVDGLFKSLQKMERTDHKLMETYNLGNNNPITTIDLLRKMEKVSGLNANFVFAPPPIGDVPVTYADIGKAQREIGYQPLTSIDEGLEKFWNWLYEQE